MSTVFNTGDAPHPPKYRLTQVRPGKWLAVLLVAMAATTSSRCR